MRLLNDATSPFGRKIMVAALERKIPLAEQFIDVYSPGEIDHYNSLRQIPTLITDDDRGVFDSAVIISMLDALHGGAPLVPDDRKADVLVRAALADGVMEAVLQRVMELRRPPQRQDSAFVDKLEGRINRSLRRINDELAGLAGDPPTADAIAVACALEYVDFRFPVNWRETYPGLAAWADAFAVRSSMVSTRPSRTAPCAPIAEGEGR
ncbi:MAG: glutathione S-transferase C-terminal domain-containing protein [Aquisalimonadaceae bacterium]